MPLRILAVNPNTSGEVTQVVLNAARGVLPPDVEVVGVTGRFGARIVTTEAEHVIAAYSALDLAAHHADGFDGVVLAISFDSGLAALRASLPMPVTGLTGSASAAAGGRKLGAVILGEATRDMYLRLFASYGTPLCALEVVEFADVNAYLDPAARQEAVAEAVERLADTGAETAILCGAALLGMAATLAPRARLPLFDGTEAFRACLAAIARGPEPTPRQAGIGETSGLPGPLAALVRGDWPRKAGP